jgi:hypothetical protein
MPEAVVREHLVVLGPVVLVVGQTLPPTWRRTRLLTLAAGGAATVYGLWSRYREAVLR